MGHCTRPRCRLARCTSHSPEGAAAPELRRSARWPRSTRFARVPAGPRRPGLRTPCSGLRRASRSTKRPVPSPHRQCPGHPEWGEPVEGGEQEAEAMRRCCNALSLGSRAPRQPRCQPLLCKPDSQAAHARSRRKSCHGSAVRQTRKRHWWPPTDPQRR